MENRVQNFYESTTEQAGDAIKSQPVAAVVVSVGLGILAGVLIVGMFPVKHPYRDWYPSNISRSVMDNLGKITPASWTS